ncbi:MAG: hypothetical protein GXO74_12760 [Calditrichaeota bacterium]|nr:hypothetical protein [Calditrichota bacterium]
MAIAKNHYFRKIILLAFFSILVIFNGCMMMGARAGRAIINSNHSGRPDRIKEVNKGDVVDDLLRQMVADLNQRQLSISNIAVWQIKSKTAGIDVEMIRQKLTAKLVNQTKFKVIARERLNELLKEHNLSLSGTIDEKSAVEIGRLISVEGFIDGYVSLNNNLLSVSLTLIETKSGAIVWAKTAESEYR